MCKRGALHTQQSNNVSTKIFFLYIFGELECVGHSFDYAHFVFLINVCIQTQKAAVASRRATNLATHLPT